ncbi:hypothetical protein [Nocardioides sp. L-11A]|uniref:hypothetical protein n=1 Tax=Nocardioides sp. L-11A TaxID=3043848 RepID=UPI00249A8843|nr:hypothetical protein QJ852_06435 [Nocardioides sp. L-11A]
MADDDLSEDQMDKLADLELELIDSQLRVKELRQQLVDELRRRNRLITQGLDWYGRTERWAVDVADISRSTVQRALADASIHEG